MRVKIDKSKCAGHNRCNSGYPEVFGISGEGESYVHCYTDFIEPKYRDVAPHIVEEDNGRHVFKIKDLDMTVPLALADGACYSIEERARRQDDWVAFRVKELLDPQQLIWANDFPHTDSTWPNSQELLAEHASGLTEAERQAIMRDNVAQLFNLPAGNESWRIAAE